jgi:phosphatidate cytidylyltransferase
LKNLVQRTFSGIIYLIVIIGSVLLGKYAFGVLFMIVVLVSLAEFFDLLGFQNSSVSVVGWLSGAGIFVLAFLSAAGIIDKQYLALATLFPVLSLISILYSHHKDVIREMALVWLGVLYIAIPLSAMNFLVFSAVNGYHYTHRIILGILILVWINDTGAYVTGTTLGKHKLFPRISPKKSWEGFAGGTVLTLVAAIWMNRIMGILIVRDWMILAGIACVMGVYGDLVESLIKRNVNRKDSGDLIPGHGGVLDRFDSLLFVVPAALIYLVLLTG